MSDKIDPKGLIPDAYRMEGITKPECRSIFLDWALSLPEEHDQPAALAEIHSLYAQTQPDHPMSEVIAEGLAAAARPKRRGGWRARRSD